MSFYVKKDGTFEQPEPLYRECPHCGVHAEMRPMSTPSFALLDASRPSHTGIVFECAACRAPRFARVAVRSFAPERIELASSATEIERAPEKFPFSHLPEEIAAKLQDAFSCYTHDLHSAFGVMCRRVVQASMLDLRNQNGTDLTALFDDAVRLADVDSETAARLRQLLFEADVPEPRIDAMDAAVLVELLRDLFHQCYVRRARLRAAVRMRRFFAGETTRKVTPIGPLARQSGSV